MVPLHLYTMVSFLFPSEQSARLSFLDLRGRKGPEIEDDEEDEERVEVAEGVGLGGSSELGEEGAEAAARGQFSSISSKWMMAETVDDRRLAQMSVLAGVDMDSFSGSGESFWVDMALRRQLSHCCLWKMSLTCSVWDWPWDESWKRTRKMFLATGGGGGTQISKSNGILKESLTLRGINLTFICITKGPSEWAAHANVSILQVFQYEILHWDWLAVHLETMPVIPCHRPGQDQNLREQKNVQLLRRKMEEKRRQRKKRGLVIDMLFERWTDLQVLTVFSPGTLKDSPVIVSCVWEIKGANSFHLMALFEIWWLWCLYFQKMKDRNYLPLRFRLLCVCVEEKNSPCHFCCEVHHGKAGFCTALCVGLSVYHPNIPAYRYSIDILTLLSSCWCQPTQSE